VLRRINRMDMMEAGEETVFIHPSISHRTPRYVRKALAAMAVGWVIPGRHEISPTPVKIVQSLGRKDFRPGLMRVMTWRPKKEALVPGTDLSS
jgi:hypothetical protein